MALHHYGDKDYYKKMRIVEENKQIDIQDKEALKSIINEVLVEEGFFDAARDAVNKVKGGFNAVKNPIAALANTVKFKDVTNAIKKGIQALHTNNGKTFQAAMLNFLLSGGTRLKDLDNKTKELIEPLALLINPKLEAKDLGVITDKEYQNFADFILGESFFDEKVLTTAFSKFKGIEQDKDLQARIKANTPTIKQLAGNARSELRSLIEKTMQNQNNG